MPIFTQLLIVRSQTLSFSASSGAVTSSLAFVKCHILWNLRDKNISAFPLRNRSGFLALLINLTVIAIRKQPATWDFLPKQLTNVYDNAGKCKSVRPQPPKRRRAQVKSPNTKRQLSVSPMPDSARKSAKHPGAPYSKRVLPRLGEKRDGMKHRNGAIHYSAIVANHLSPLSAFSKASPDSKILI